MPSNVKMTYNRNVLPKDQISDKDIFRIESLFGFLPQTWYVCVDVKNTMLM